MQAQLVNLPISNKKAQLFPGKPLLIVHGWPGSIWEFYKMIPMLTDPAAYGGRDEDAFEVIAPSIPGYGFSEAPHRQGSLQIKAEHQTKPDVLNPPYCDLEIVKSTS